MALEFDAKPKGAKVFIDGAWYKINPRGLVCVHNNYEWMTSAKDKDDVEKAIRLNEKITDGN
jgi:hypothetical protein